MKGNEKVIALLNQQLESELAAGQQYALHAAMQANWGYEGLAQHSAEEASEEAGHARRLMDRILFLEGEPKVGMALKVKTGDTVPLQHQADLAAEMEAVKTYAAAAVAAEGAGDVGTRDLLASILHDEEEHVNWLETQLRIIEDVGLENYLIEQVEADA